MVCKHSLYRATGRCYYVKEVRTETLLPPTRRVGGRSRVIMSSPAM